jgi:hypothetical protein
MGTRIEKLATFLPTDGAAGRDAVISGPDENTVTHPCHYVLSSHKSVPTSAISLSKIRSTLFMTSGIR